MATRATKVDPKRVKKVANITGSSKRVAKAQILQNRSSRAATKIANTSSKPMTASRNAKVARTTAKKAVIDKKVASLNFDDYVDNAKRGSGTMPQRAGGKGTSVSKAKVAKVRKITGKTALAAKGQILEQRSARIATKLNKASTSLAKPGSTARARKLTAKKARVDAAATKTYFKDMVRRNEKAGRPRKMV